MRSLAFRLVAVLLGTLLGLLALEAALWIVSVVAPPLLLRGIDRQDGAAVRIICVGDSHTFGVMMPPDQAYPARLQHHLAQQGLTASVVNLGVPGMNSMQIRTRLPGYLERYRPHAVGVFVGANNAWNVAERDRAEVSWTTMLAQHIRVLRFARLLLAARDTDPDYPMEPLGRASFEGKHTNPTWILPQAHGGTTMRPQQGNTRPSDDLLTTWAREDFDAITRLSRAHGARVILIKYPFPGAAPYRAANAAIDELATNGRALIVDGSEIFQRLQRNGGGPVLFDDPGMHPRPVLYDEIARAAAEHILTAP